MRVTDNLDGVLRLEGEMAASPGDVYRYFTEPDLLTRWWAETAQTDPRPGGTYALGWPSHEWELAGEYLVAEPGERLTFTWSFAHEDRPPSTVDLRFAASGDGCHLVIEHTHQMEGPEREEYREGWQHFAARLAAALR